MSQQQFLNQIKQKRFSHAGRCIIVLSAFPSLYATLVTVACSQLEKLRTSLLVIRQSHVITDHDSGEDNYHHHHHTHSERHTDISEHVFQHTRRQLNDYLRHHQNIKWYDHV
jgi:hypothetical protein